VNRKKIILIVLLSLISIIALGYLYARQYVNLAWEKSDIDLSKIELPQGFKIEIYAEDVINARSITRSPEGTIFVGTKDEGSVYALRDEDGDNRAENMWRSTIEFYDMII